MLSPSSRQKTLTSELSSDMTTPILLSPLLKPTLPLVRNTVVTTKSLTVESLSLNAFHDVDRNAVATALGKTGQLLVWNIHKVRKLNWQDASRAFLTVFTGVQSTQHTKS
jgi:hypothetical protein